MNLYSDGDGIDPERSDRGNGSRSDTPVGELLFDGESYGSYEGTELQRSILSTAIERPRDTIRSIADAAGCSDPWVTKTVSRATRETIAETFGDDLAEAYAETRESYLRTGNGNGNGGIDARETRDRYVKSLELPIQRTDDGLEFLAPDAGYIGRWSGPGIGNVAGLYSAEYCPECDEIHPIFVLVDVETTNYAVPPRCTHEQQRAFSGGDDPVTIGLIRAILADQFEHGRNGNE